MSERGVSPEMLQRQAARTAYPPDLPPIPPLPAARYADPAFHALEMEHVFGKTWLGVGHVSELPEPGAYKLFEQIDQSIIISRGIDNEIRAFKNVCRHRGAAILTEPKGTARRFVCPYHAWGYASDGMLKSVPEPQNFACLNKDELSLIKVRCEIWRGFIFINLDDQAMPLAEYMAPLTAEVADFPMEAMRVKATVVTEIDCNWKTAYDNFLESYHINTVHRKTIAPFMDTRTWTAKRLAFGHGCLVTSKKGGNESIFQSRGVMEVADRFRTSIIAIPRFPNATTGLDPAGFNWQSFWPKGVDKMVMVNIYVGPEREDADADRAYWQDFVAYNDTILAEDMHLFPSIQRAMRKGDIPHLLLSTQEIHIQWYHEHLDRAIGIERIPPELRVDPVLSSLAT